MPCMTALAVCDGEVVVRGGIERERCKVERWRDRGKRREKRPRETSKPMAKRW